MNNAKKIALVFSMFAIFTWFIMPLTGEKNTTSARSLSTDILVNANNPVLKLIADSHSPRNFIAGEINQLDIERILMSGAKAPSARNYQPWHFTVVQNHEKVAAITNMAKQGNIIIIISGNRSTTSAQFDCALAAQNMQLASQAIGLGARMLVNPVAGIEKNHRTAFGIPQTYDVFIVILIGHVDKSADAVSSATPRAPLAEKVNYVK